MPASAGASAILVITVALTAGSSQIPTVTPTGAPSPSKTPLTGQAIADIANKELDDRTNKTWTNHIHQQNGPNPSALPLRHTPVRQ